MLIDEHASNRELVLRPAGALYAPEDQITTLFDLSSTTALYIGYGPQGSDPAQPQWTIRKITLTSGSPTASNWTAKGAAVWANRTTETYL